MRVRRAWVVGSLLCASTAWVACGGDDASVNGTDSGASDATTSDASSGSDTGTIDSGGNTDSGGGGCDAGPIPGVPPGRIYCSGDPAGCEVDASYCCDTQCKPLAQLCLAGGGSAECTRPTDCATGVCCAKITGTIDLDSGTCPAATADINQFTCAGATQHCPLEAVRVCVQNSDCDAGSCIPVAATIADAGTTIGLCVP